MSSPRFAAGCFSVLMPTALILGRRCTTEDLRRGKEIAGIYARRYAPGLLARMLRRIETV